MERPIYFGQILDKTDTSSDLSPGDLEAWQVAKKKDRSLADTNMRERGKTSGFTIAYAQADRVCSTLTTQTIICKAFPRYLNTKELLQVSTFPQDYKYPNPTRLRWLTGMSVPPVMTAQIANQIYLQLFKK